MSKKYSWRKVLAVPAILSLALGGALVTSATANAAPAGLVIDSPAEGSVVASRTVTVSGQAFAGSIITVSANGGELKRTTVAGPTDVSSPFSVTLPTFADDAPAAQTLSISGIYGGSGIPTQTRSITLPTVAPAPFLVVTSPAEGSTVESRTVTFNGTGIAGANVNVLYPNGSRFAPQTRVADDGTWSATGTFAADAAVAQAIRITQVDGGAGRGDITRNIVLPAVAPAPFLVVTSPAEGSTVESRTVTFSGTGIAGALVNVLYPNGSRFAPQTRVADDGTWSATGTFAADAAVAQAIRITQVDGGAGRGDITRNIVLPAVAPAPFLVVTSPAEGSTVESRTVTFSGTGIAGALVNVLYPNGSRFAPQTRVADDGTWSATGTFADDAATAQAIRITQVDGGAGRGDITRNIVLPAEAELLAAPVITDPTEGETITGDNVTFTGTGVVGANVLLVVLPTDVSPLAAQDPADPTDPIVVDEDGNWTVTLALKAAEYTAVATLVELDADGVLVGVTSEPSAPVSFTVADAVTVPGGTGGTGDTVDTEGPLGQDGVLASTGASASGFIGLAGLLTLAGCALIVARRKRELLV